MKQRIFLKTVQIVVLLAVLAAMLAVPAGASGAELDSGTTLRVGMAYGSSALAAANLENHSGSGYRFGYYDSALDFVELASTEQTKISMLKTHNIYLTDTKAYTTSATSNGAVGCFHVQLPGGYSDYPSAKAAADGAGGFVAWIGGTYYVRVGSYVSRSLAASAAAGYEGGTVGETTKYGISATVTGTTDILFQFDDEGSGTGLGVRPDVTGAADPQTWFQKFRYRGGFRYQRIDGGDLTVVNVVSLGDYVKGVVPYEVSPSWPAEALKAQAVCARTYALSNLGKHSRLYGFDVCTRTDCQVYQGTNREDANTRAAVDDTAGVTIKYGGKYIDAVFSSSDGGATESSKNVWGTEHPYLQGVVDPYEASVAREIADYQWTKTFTGAELQAKLVSSGRANCGVIVGVSVTKTDMGNVYSMTFTDANGKNWTVYRGDCRTVFSFRSQRFDLNGAPSSPSGGGSVMVNGKDTASSGLYTIDGSGNKTPLSGSFYVITDSGTQTVDSSSTTGGGTSSSSASSNGSFTFKGSGWGHNVGLSQYGAYAMAKQGFSYIDILTFYYTGVTVGT